MVWLPPLPPPSQPHEMVYPGMLTLTVGKVHPEPPVVVVSEQAHSSLSSEPHPNVRLCFHPEDSSQESSSVRFHPEELPSSQQQSPEEESPPVPQVAMTPVARSMLRMSDAFILNICVRRGGGCGGDDEEMALQK